MKSAIAKCCVSSAMASLLLVTGALPAEPPRFDARLAHTPPKVASATVELLARSGPDGNAIIRVSFANGRRSEPLAITGLRGPTLLRDDGRSPDDRAGDGSYAAIVQVNAELFAQDQRRRFELSKRFDSVPVFDGRELLGYRKTGIHEPVLLAPGVRRDIGQFQTFGATVSPGRELLVRHTSVVEDPARTWEPCTGAGTPMGAWTFGRLMTEMANQPVTGIHPSDFVEHWVNQWKSDLNINGFTVTQRAIGAQALLDIWPKLPDGRLDLAQAPFRLLAIVNRQDLRGNALYAAPVQGAEARLVFGAVKCNGIDDNLLTFDNTSDVLQFTVIFEYDVALPTCFAARDWAQQWRALGGLSLGSSAYKTALQAITDQFTLRDARPNRLPNRSAINQVRINEFALSQVPAQPFWQLRESKLQTTGTQSGYLEHMTVAQTPDISFQLNSAILADFINFNENDIQNGKHVVPLTFPGSSPFRAGFRDSGDGGIWDPLGTVDSEALHKFSLATCNGCHRIATFTNFLHIEPREMGTMSVLSDFLTGANMPTPSGRTFDELLDRQEKLEATANMTCGLPGDFALDELQFIPREPALLH